MCPAPRPRTPITWSSSRTPATTSASVRHHHRFRDRRLQGGPLQVPEQEFPVRPDKPSVKLFGTGSTIASRLDYRTGACIPAFSPGELYGWCRSWPTSATWSPRSCSGSFWEHGTRAIPGPGRAGRRGDPRGLSRGGGRPRHRRHAPHRRRPEFMVQTRRFRWSWWEASGPRTGRRPTRTRTSTTPPGPRPGTIAEVMVACSAHLRPLQPVYRGTRSGRCTAPTGAPSAPSKNPVGHGGRRPHPPLKTDYAPRRDDREARFGRCSRSG